MMDTLEKVAQDYGLTPDGVRYALSQYQKIIEELTGGMLSKLNYTSETVCEYVKARFGSQEHLKRWLEMVLSNTNPLDRKARAAFAECLAKVNAIDIDAEPVRHGHVVWRNRFMGGFVPDVTITDNMGEKHTGTLDTTHYEPVPYCSDCGKELGVSSLAYCPNCGAKMDAKEG